MKNKLYEVMLVVFAVSFFFYLTGFLTSQVGTLIIFGSLLMPTLYTILMFAVWMVTFMVMYKIGGFKLTKSNRGTYGSIAVAMLTVRLVAYIPNLIVMSIQFFTLTPRPQTIYGHFAEVLLGLLLDVMFLFILLRHRAVIEVEE